MSGRSILTAQAIQIVKVNEDAHTFRLSDEDLTNIILQENIRNRDVVIVSVAGAFRKGKSFILDFFLRYMYSKVMCKCVNKRCTCFMCLIFSLPFILVCSLWYGI